MTVMYIKKNVDGTQSLIARVRVHHANHNTAKNYTLQSKDSNCMVSRLHYEISKNNR